jgi:hypothetical protein
MNNHFLPLLLLCLTSCTSPGDTAQKPSQGYHNFALTVADTNPMHGSDAEFAVEVPWWKTGKAREGGVLYWYSNFKRPKASQKHVPSQEDRVPSDTLSIGLNRAQLDSIYQLAQQVFAIPSKPFLEDDSFPHPPFPHDLDNYLVVTFYPQRSSGAYFECSGYKEHNEASYKLAAYLEKVKAEFLHR